MTELEELRNRIDILENRVKELERGRRPSMEFTPDRPLGPLPRNEAYEETKLREFLDTLVDRFII